MYYDSYREWADQIAYTFAVWLMQLNAMCYLLALQTIETMLLLFIPFVIS